MKIVTDLSLTSAPRNARGDWHPARLFHSGAQGACFDPSASSPVWGDTTGTVAAGVADMVARMDDKSGNGHHATQEVSSARPFLGRVPASMRRNLIAYTEKFDAPAWNEADVTVTPDTATAVDGAVTADKIETTGGNPRIYQALLSWTANMPYTGSVWIRGGNITEAFLQFFRNGGGGVTHTDARILSGPGAVFGIGSTGITITGLSLSEWTRISITGTPEAGGSLAFYVKNRLSGSMVGDYNYIWGAQLEQAAVASEYQTVQSSYDVTEPGVPSLTYLYRDGIDDALEASLTALGNATLAWSSDAGVTIQTGQSVASGGFDILRDKMLFGMVIIDRDLTGWESSKLSEWLANRAGDYA